MGSEKGFSIAELLVGISIVGIMATFSSLVYKEYKHKAYRSAALAQASDMKKSIEAVMTDSSDSNLFDEDRLIVIDVDGTYACQSGCDDIDLDTLFVGFSHDLGSRLEVNIHDDGAYEIYSGHCMSLDTAEENYLGWMVTDTQSAAEATFESNTTFAQCVAVMKTQDD